MHDRSAFLTLTYRPQNLPVSGSLDVRPLQLFWKRLRKSRPRSAGPVRYLACGEYGEELGRPHYHACVFGEDFASDRQLWKQTSAGPLFISKRAESLWGLGFVVIGDVSFESAAYVARYTVKKVRGEAAAGHYGPLKPEFLVSSRRPGLGSTWWERYGQVVKRDDAVVLRGRSMLPPKAYDRFHERDDLESWRSTKGRRVARALERGEEHHWARLRVREKVAEAKLKAASRVYDSLE